MLMGRSLGGAVAVDLAADGARGLVLESTFTSMPEVGQTMLPYLPVRSVMRTQFNSLAKIGKYHGPLLQSHGTADRLIPYAMGRQLFAAANEPKQFIAIPGGDHNDPAERRLLRGPRRVLRLAVKLTDRPFRGVSAASRKQTTQAPQTCSLDRRSAGST